MNFQLEKIFRLEETADFQYLIRAAIVDGDDTAAAALDDLLTGKADGYKLAALWIAYDLMRLMAKAGRHAN